jgi:hypothetical protein
MGITYGEKGLSKVGTVGAEVIRVTADSLPQDGERKRDGVLGWQLQK